MSDKPRRFGVLFQKNLSEDLLIVELATQTIYATVPLPDDEDGRSLEAAQEIANIYERITP